MNVLETIQRTMRSTFLDDAIQISRETTAIEVDGWDSLSHSMLILSLEQAFSVQMDVEITNRCVNVGELADYISSLLA